jgi:acetylornithine deacetylase/succinyl-diaminopimelate desuccinylase-like protein
VVAAVVGAFDGDEPTAGAALKVDRFNRDRAWADLRYQVALGPRPAGSETSKQLAEWLRERLPNGRFQKLPGGLQNVIGSLPGRGKPIVVAAHYDTKDIPGFVGANDGAGGTAAVLEIARALKRWPADNPPLRFVLFDGEESPDDSKDFYASGLRGSKYYARRFADRTRAMILLDFVAEKGGMRIPREDSSSIELWGRLRAAARKVGAQSAFPDETAGAVLDDHTPFLRRGVPANDLIEFTFDCWHKTCDDMSAVSARALDLSGETVVQLLLDLSR